MKPDFPNPLLDKLRQLPSQPGVYFHKDKDGNIIYVGKAAILKNRVRQYFQGYKNKDAKTKALIREIKDVDFSKFNKVYFVACGTAYHACLCGAQILERATKLPVITQVASEFRYNDPIIDEKTLCIYVSQSGETADTLAALRLAKSKGCTTIAIANVLGSTILVGALVVCVDSSNNLDSDMGLNPGIEIGKSSPKEYKRNLQHLEGYLRGNRKSLIKEIEKEMKQAAKEQDFERAASLRNELFGLKGLSTKIIFSDHEFLDISNDAALLTLQKILRLKRPPKRIEGYDISHQAGENVVGSMVTFINGTAERSEYKRFKLHTQKNDDTASLAEVISRRLRHLNTWGKPDLIVLDGGVPQGNLEIIELPRDSHVAKLISRIDEESHRFAITYHRLLNSKKIR